MKKSLRNSLLSITLFTASQVSMAAFVTPSEWTRGDTGTLYAEWDIFDGYPLSTTPDIGSSNITSTTLTETTGTAFLTGGGNIYGFSAATFFTLDVDSNASGTQGNTGNQSINLQLRVLGTDIDTSSITLGGTAGSVSLLEEIPLGGFGGTQRDYLISWNSTQVDNFAFAFNAASSHMSLDRLALDIGPSAAVSAVPVPAAAWLFGSALLGLAGVGRKRG